MNPDITLPRAALVELVRRYAAVAGTAWRHRRELAGPARLADELAFLPAHLSLQDTPVHPAPRRTALAICALFSTVLVWSLVGELDIVAVAPGRIVVTERSKTVQPLETSVVRAIRVAEGDHVTAGQVLIELDPTASQADNERLRQEQASALAEWLRCQSLLARLGGSVAGMDGSGYGGGAFDTGRSEGKASGLPMLREDAAPTLAPGLRLTAAERSAAQAQLMSEWADIQARQARLNAELQRRQAEQRTAEQQVAKLHETLPLARQREADFAALQAQGFVAGHASQDRSRERLELERDLATAQARVTETQAAIAESRQGAQALRAETLRNLRERLAQAQLKLASLAPERSKAGQRQRLTQLTAPVTGTVQQLAIHTAGGVVTPAQPLLVVVPDEAPIHAEVQLENKDIGFVRVGQKAQIKLDAFPFTRYGTVEATVMHVSADAVVDPQKETAAYVATLQLTPPPHDGQPHPPNATPGMKLGAEIITGRRRVIDYLLEPVQVKTRGSLGER